MSNLKRKYLYAWRIRLGKILLVLLVLVYHNHDHNKLMLPDIIIQIWSNVILIFTNKVYAKLYYNLLWS